MFLGIRSIWRFIYAFIKHLRSAICQNKFAHVHKKSVNIYISWASFKKFSHSRYFGRSSWCTAWGISCRACAKEVSTLVSPVLWGLERCVCCVCYGLPACLSGDSPTTSFDWLELRGRRRILGWYKWLFIFKRFFWRQRYQQWNY